MPLYFFDTADGDTDIDQSGTEFADDAAAVVGALRYAASLVLHTPAIVEASHPLAVTVRSDADRTLAQVRIALELHDMPD